MTPRNWVYVGYGRSTAEGNPLFPFSYFGTSPLWEPCFLALDQQYARSRATRARLTRQRALRKARPVRFK